MSLTKPDSLSEGNPYAYGSKGALLFQRMFFLLLFLALSGVFIYFLVTDRTSQINPEILVLRLPDSTPDLNLGVPFQQADLDLIQKTLELKTEQALVPSREAFLARVRELLTLERSAAVVYLKGYGGSKGDGGSISQMQTNEDRLPEPDPEADVPQTDTGAFVRLNGETISASEIVNAAFEVDDKPDSRPEIATRLLVLDCSQALSNFRINMFSNLFPARIAAILQGQTNAEPKDHWVLLPCGVNQLSYPSPDMKSTAFAKAFAEGLQGRADTLAEWGNQNGTVELKELYNYICSVCAFESQLPLLLNYQGVAVLPFDSTNPEDRGPVLAKVIPNKAADTDSPRTGSEEPPTDPDKAEPSEKKAESAVPKTAQNPPSFAQGSSRRRNHRTLSPSLFALGAGLPKLPGIAITGSSFSLTQQESGAPPASGSTEKQNPPTTKGATSPENSAEESVANPPTTNGAEPGQSAGKPGNLNSDPWDSLRAQLLRSLKEHRTGKLDFVAARLQIAETTEKDFRQRFLAGDLETPSSVSPASSVAGTHSPNAPDRDDLVKARARAASTGKESAFEKSVLAWDAILSTRFQLPSFIEWHDHLSILDPVGAAEFRERISLLINDLEQLEAEVLKFDAPLILDEGAIGEQTAKTEQSLAAVTQYVSLSLEEAGSGLLYAILRTPLLTSQERNNVVAQLASKLKDRKPKPPNESAFKNAVEDHGADQHIAVVLKLRLRLDDSSAAEMTDAPDAVSPSDRLSKLASTAQIKDTLSWLRLASALSQAECRTPSYTPALTVPFFPLEPKLRLVLSESEEAQKRLVPKERRSLRFQLTLSDHEESLKTDEIGTEIRFVVEPPDAIDLRIRSASMDEQPVDQDLPYRFRLNTSGQLHFELSAEAANYITRQPSDSVLPAVSIRVIAATRIGETNLSVEIPASLPLPVKELIALEVEGDPRIPQSASSHNRTLRILPNTVTLNTLKLRNKTLKPRTVRVEVFAMNEMPNATWPPGLLYAADPSPLSEPPLFKLLESALKSQTEKARLIGPLIAQSGPFLLPVAITDADPAQPIPFTASAAAPPVNAAAPAAEPAAAQPGASSLPEVSHGLFLNVIDLKEVKDGDKVSWVEADESWPHWLEVNPLHPRVLFDASAEWSHSQKEVQVRVTRKLTDNAESATEVSQKTTVRFTLADRQGWPIAQSDTVDLTADGFTFQNVVASEDNHLIFVDIDGYPRALVIELQCLREKDSSGRFKTNWTNARFTYFGSESEGLFARQREGFSLARKEAKNLPPRLFPTPFFSAKAAGDESKSRQGIPVGLQIDGSLETDRRPVSGEKSHALRPGLKGVRELESLKFLRDRRHQQQLAAAKPDGTFAVTSKVEDWRTEWTPTTDGNLVDLEIGMFAAQGAPAQDPDKVSVLIDGTPPEFRLSPLALSIEEGSDGILEVQQRDQSPSAPVERIEFNLVDADDQDKPFAEAAIVPNLTVSWPGGKVQQIKIVPSKLMKLPGRYLIKARTTDALGRQSSDVTPIELVIRQKPAPKPEMKDNAPKKGTVRLRFLYNGMPLKQSAKLEVTVSDETKDKDSAVDGVIEFSKEAELDKPVDVVVKWSVRRNTTMKTATKKINPVAKDKDVEILIEDLEAEAAKK